MGCYCISISLLTASHISHGQLCFSFFLVICSNFMSDHSFFISVIVRLCSDDMSLAAVLLIFSYSFWSPNTTTDTTKLVIFLSSDFRQQNFRLCGSNFFFLLFGNIFVQETCPQRERNRKPYMAFFRGFMLIIKFDERAFTHERWCPSG